MSFQPLHVMILAGGKGTRLKSVVDDRPKVMADVNGKPFLNWILDHLHQQGVREITLLTGYMANLIENFYGSNYREIRLFYSREVSPLGTGGAVKLALKRLDHKKPFCLLLNGDTYFPADLIRAVNFQSPLANRILTTQVADTSRYGSLQIDLDSGIVLNFNEKGQYGPGLVSAGTYILETEALLDAPSDIFSLETDLLRPLASKGKLLAVKDQAQFIDIGLPADYAHFKFMTSSK
jgi:D-glycero-alpha-D-manno-heptose 1-phosphate guanylyltransferase